MGYKEDFPCHYDFAKEAVTEYYDKLEKSEEKLKKAENDMKELHQQKGEKASYIQEKIIGEIKILNGKRDSGLKMCGEKLKN